MMRFNYNTAHCSVYWGLLNIIKLGRNMQTIIFRLETGHWKLNAHLHQMGPIGSASCRCGALNQTQEQVLQDNPNSSQQQGKLGRNMQIIIFRLGTGHWKHNAHHQMGPVGSASCRCGAPNSRACPTRQSGYCLTERKSGQVQTLQDMKWRTYEDLTFNALFVTHVRIETQEKLITAEEDSFDLNTLI